MIAFLLTILLLTVVFFIQKWNPLVAGLLAVIPIKIIGTSLMVLEGGSTVELTKAIEGMLIGQFVIGFVLLGVWLWLR